MRQKAILGRSFNHYERKRMGLGALICCFFMAFTLFKPFIANYLPLISKYIIHFNIKFYTTSYLMDCSFTKMYMFLYAYASTSLLVIVITIFFMTTWEHNRKIELLLFEVFISMWCISYSKIIVLSTTDPGGIEWGRPPNHYTTPHWPHKIRNLRRKREIDITKW